MFLFTCLHNEKNWANSRSKSGQLLSYWVRHSPCALLSKYKSARKPPLCWALPMQANVNKKHLEISRSDYFWKVIVCSDLKVNSLGFKTQTKIGCFDDLYQVTDQRIFLLPSVKGKNKDFCTTIKPNYFKKQSSLSSFLLTWGNDTGPGVPSRLVICI